MSDRPRHESVDERIAREAAAWVLRSDRGLTAAEQDEFSGWLAADTRHGAALARQRGHWARLDQLAQWRPEHSARPNPDLLAVPLRKRVLRYVPATAALAAAAAVAFVFFQRPAPPSSAPAGPKQAVAPVATTPAAAAPTQRVLTDGSIVELNRGAVLSVDFSPSVRRVVLERGEAHFAVTKDASRPFVVRAHGIDVQAVGTAFNVRVDAAVVEVLVTEGQVRLDAAEQRAEEAADAREAIVPRLEARQRAVVSLARDVPTPQIATLTAGEIERVLAWQHRLLDFTATPLHEVVAEFNRRNVTQLVVVDPELASVRVSATLRSDNIDGFVRMLEVGFSARAERRGETEIVLRKGN